MKIGIANAAEVDQIWPLISEKMQAGCNRTGGGTSSADLWQMCRGGDAFLVIGFTPEAVKFASVWRFETWPSGQVFKCIGLCGSDPKKWIADLHEFVLSQARIAGTTRLVAEGRRGWSRIFERYVSKRTRTLWETYEVM